MSLTKTTAQQFLIPHSKKIIPPTGEFNVDSITFENWVNSIAEALKHSSKTFEITPKEQIQSLVRNELIRKTNSVKDELRKLFLFQDIS